MKVIKKLLFSIAIAFFLLLGLIATLPYVASTHSGKNFLINQFNHFIPGRLAIGSLDLHWGKQQTIKDLQLFDSKGTLVISIQELAIEGSLINFIGKNWKLGSTRIVSPYIHITQDQSGLTNLQQALLKKNNNNLSFGLSSSESEGLQTSHDFITGNIQLENGHLILETETTPPVHFYNIGSQVVLAENSPNSVISLQGFSKQGELEGHFALTGSISANKLNIFNLQSNDTVDLKLDVFNLPTIGLDQFANNAFFSRVLGSNINLSSEIKANSSSISITCNLQSEHLKAQFKGSSQNGQFIFDNAEGIPNFLHLNLTPTLLNDYLPQSFHVDQAAQLQVNFQSVSIPLNSDWQKIALEANFNLSSFRCANQFTLEDFTGNLSATSLKDALRLDYQGYIQKTPFSGYLFLSELAKMHFQGTINQMNLEGLGLPESLGTVLSANFQGWTTKQGTLVQTRLETSKLKTSEIKLFYDDIICLVEPADFTYQLDSQEAIKATIQSASAKKNNDSWEINSDCDWFLSGLQLPQIAFNELKGHVISQLQITHKDDQWNVSIPNLETNFTSTNISGYLKGAIDSEAFFIHSPGRLELLVTPENVNKLFDKQNQKNLIKEAFKTAIVLDQLHIPLKPFDLRKIQLNGSATIPQLLIDTVDSEASFTKMQSKFSIDGIKNSAEFEFLAHSHIGYQNTTSNDQLACFNYDGKIKAITSIKNFIRGEKFNWAKAIYYLDIAVDEFPTQLLDVFTETKGLYSSLLGPVLQLQLSTHYVPAKEEEGLIEIVAISDGFKADLAIEIDDALKIHRSKPSFIHWELTPKRYQYLQQMVRTVNSSAKTDFVLLEPANVDITIAELTCPTTPVDGLSSFFCQSGLVANITVSPMPMINQTSKEKVTIQNLHATVNGKNFTENIHCDLGGYLATPSQNAFFGFIGDLEHAWTQNGHFNRDQLSAKGTLSLKQLSVGTMTGIIPMESQTRQQLRALLGDQVNAQISLSISQLAGPINIDIDSNNFKAYIPAQLGNGNLTLRDQVSAEMHLTEELSSSLLSGISPFLTAAESATPIRLYVDPQGFVIPLRPFNLRGVNVEKAVIDLGKFNVQNGGTMQKLMEFLKAKGVSSDGQMEAWFTPIFMQLKDGVIQYKRFDALLGNNVHTAFWGRLDLNKNKMNMVMAISPETMKSAFGISGLPDEYMFQIKMKGPVDKVEIDWKSASTRIGVLMARTAGGFAGLLIGKLFDLIKDILGDQTTPSQTIYPFPWAKNAPPRTDQMPVETYPPFKKSILAKLFSH